MNFISEAFADTAPTQATTVVPNGAAPMTPPQPGLASLALPFALMLGVLYFLMIRPQQKKMKEHEQLVSGLQKGDDVVTQSGILGKVYGITDKVIDLEVSNNVRIKMLRSQIATVLKGDQKLV